MYRRKFLKWGGIGAAGMLFADNIFASMNAFTKIRPISGSWFEFRHASVPEGKYWNDTLASFTEAQWKAKIREIRDTGMEYLVLMSVAENGKTFYPSALQPGYDYACPDPLEAVLSAADECGIRFFVSNDFWADPQNVDEMMKSKNIALLREKGMEEIAEKYAHHKSFYGWYYPNESGLYNTIDETTIQYVNNCTRKARQLTPNSVNLIAPYGTKSIRFDDRYIRQLERLDIDIVAYQDEIGVRKTKAGTAGKYYEGLFKMHQKAGRSRLWADLEVFEFEGNVYSSALIPASFGRVLTQLEDISPFVEKILIYQYVGLMNKPGSAAFAGHKDSEKLYLDYINWLQKRNKA